MQKLLVAIVLLSLFTLLNAKNKVIDIHKSKGTKQDMIVSLYPSPAQIDVNRSTTIKAMFNIPLDIKHIKKNGIKLTKLSHKKRDIKGKVSYLTNENAMIFKPLHPLEIGYYEVEIKAPKQSKNKKEKHKKHHSKHKKIKKIKYRFYIPEIINGYILPPEPDPKINNATLLGVDINHNGIRDDVERWVVKTLAKAKFRNNLYLTEKFLLKARIHQKRLSNEDPTPQEVLKSYIEEKDNRKCISYFNEDENELYDKLVIKIQDKIYNTHERIKNFFLYEKRLPKTAYFNYHNGGSIAELEEEEKACIEEYLSFKGAKK